MYNETCADYAPCKKVNIENLGDYSGEWYFLDITPLPNFSEIEKVAADIVNNNEISMINGKLLHNSNCRAEEHKLPKEIKRILSHLKPVKYHVAIFSNPKKILFGQPLVIALNPKISYSTFPDHPHLNLAVREKNNYFPSTFCYTDTPQEIGEIFGNEIFDTIFHVSVWLFRHQIWEKTREIYGEGKWIGPSAKSGIINGEYIEILDPTNICRCGSQKKYSECCMNEDLKLYGKNVRNKKVFPKGISPKEFINHMKMLKEEVFLPEERFVNKLKEIFDTLTFD